MMRTRGVWVRVLNQKNNEIHYLFIILLDTWQVIKYAYK